MELLNDISLCLISWVTATFLFLVAVHFMFLPSSYKDSSFSASFQLSLLLFPQAISPGECGVALMAMPSCASSLTMRLSDCLCVYEPGTSVRIHDLTFQERSHFLVPYFPCVFGFTYVQCEYNVHGTQGKCDP